MKRELQFRAWDHINNEMVYQSVNVQNFGHGSIDAHDILRRFDHDYVMQYTGLKDKNGKEIYDGDVLHDGKGADGIVVWMDSVGAFVTQVGDQYFWLNEGDPTRSVNLTYTSVVGNIYEHPDLLK